MGAIARAESTGCATPATEPSGAIASPGDDRSRAKRARDPGASLPLFDARGADV